MVAAVPKPNKPQNALSGYRSIALQEPASKALAKAMRGATARALDKVAPDGVAGGRKHRPTAIPAITAQAHLAKLRRLSKPGAVLFLDGANAFYSASRAFLFKLRWQPDVNAWIGELPIRPDMKEKLIALLAGPTLIERCQVARSICDSLQASFTSTWFTTLLESPTVFCTQEGTIPGSPLADLLFQVVMTVAVDAMLENLAEAGLQVIVPTGKAGGDRETAASPAPTWLDDAAVLLEVEAARQLPVAVSTAACIAFESLQLIGVDMNFQAGKSEAIINLAGPESKAVKHQIFVEANGLIPVRAGKSTVQLRCVQSYVHLGTTASTEDMHVGDAQRRRQLTEAMFRPLYKKLLFNKWLTPIEKTRLFQAIILNKLCHGAGLWRLHTKRAMATFRAAYMTFVRRAVRPIAGFSSKLLNDSEACAAIHILLPEEALHVARYRQLAQLVSCGSSFVWGTVVQERTWLDAAACSRNLVAQGIEHAMLGPIPQGDAERMRWFQHESLGCQRETCYHHDIKKYCRNCIERSRPVAGRAHCKAALLRKLDEFGALVVSVPRPVESSVEFECCCGTCGEVFKDKRALAVHVSKKHGDVAGSSLAAFTTACEVCRKQYWTVPLARAHFQRSSRCRKVHAASDLSTGSVLKVPVEQRHLPVTQLIGPRPWWATLDPAEVATDSKPDALTVGLGDRLGEVASVDEAFTLLKWWSKQLLILEEAAISDEIDSIRVADLVGIKLQTLAVIEHMAWPEAGREGNFKVWHMGNIFVVLCRDLATQVSHAELALLQ